MEENINSTDKMSDTSSNVVMNEINKIPYTILYPIIDTQFDTVICSTTPSGAAKKVYSKYIHPYPEKNTIPNIVRIQNMDGKIFEYEVQEKVKNETVLRGNKQITYTYSVEVRSRNIHKHSGKHKKSTSPISCSTISPLKKCVFFRPRSVTKKC